MTSQDRYIRGRIRRSHELAIATLRELAIRRHQILPAADRPDEVRWAREGDRDVRSLDSLARPAREEG